MEKKKESNWGLVVFILVIAGAIGFVYYYKLVITRIPEILTADQKISYTDEELKEYYERVKLTYDEELIFTNEDIETIKGEFLLDKFSSNMRIYYGLRLVPEDEYGQETITHSVNGYTYTGRYIKSSNVKSSLMRNFGINTFNNTTIFAGKYRYYYNSSRNIYRIYENENYEPPVKKFTKVEYEWDEDNIYIIEYSAYTTEKDGVKMSYTKHNPILPIVITEKNIEENLDIIDKYRYVYTLNPNVKKFFISKIEYVDQTKNDNVLTNE